MFLPLPGIPYAWVNLRHGVRKGETPETSTAGCGSLILEMGTLSRLTGKRRYEDAALWALRKLWAMRSPANLMGTTLNVETGQWIDFSGGIGAGEGAVSVERFAVKIVFGDSSNGVGLHVDCSAEESSTSTRLEASATNRPPRNPIGASRGTVTRLANK